MAYRTTDRKVKEIISTTINTTPFIKAANVIIANHLTGKGLSTDSLELIELWLAAHLVAIRDPKLKQQSIGSATDIKDVGPLGKGLQSTHWGQQVILFDTTGTLVSMGKRLASFESLASDSDEYS